MRKTAQFYAIINKCEGGNALICCAARGRDDHREV